MIKKSFQRSAQACLWVLVLAGTCYAETPVAVSEYQAKAVYLYNFISFFEWPALSHTRFTIGIIGDDPFGRGFAEVESKPVRATGRALEILRFGPGAAPADIRDCNMLFITSSEKNQYQSILAKLGQRPVLTFPRAGIFLHRGV